jgi:uncharacterized membrane protein
MPDDKKVVDIEEKNILAALCYVGVLVFVPLLVRKNDPYVNWHIKQGLVVLVVIFVALFVSTWAERAGNLLFVIIMIVDIVALIQALLGRKWKIPLIGDVANRFKV